MKNIILFLLFTLFCNISGQSRSFAFDFNPKKFIKENKLNKGGTKEIIFNLYDINGNETKYITADRTTEALRKEQVYSFKGKSEDGTKLITLTIASGNLTGAYMENGVSYFIEPLEKNCKKRYKIYINSGKGFQVGQPNDVIQ
ncbi:hypothetical protein [Chryseobacterium sp. IT-36CA2]|uniref:hypothetical protein n=1 Tax=Chryseobacterium sp. IT-36CA2 TaxID=3026460 RepID=UPI0039E1C180